MVMDGPQWWSEWWSGCPLAVQVQHGESAQAPAPRSGLDADKGQAKEAAASITIVMTRDT